MFLVKNAKKEDVQVDYTETTVSIKRTVDPVCGLRFVVKRHPGLVVCSCSEQDHERTGKKSGLFEQLP